MLIKQLKMIRLHLILTILIFLQIKIVTKIINFTIKLKKMKMF